MCGVGAWEVPQVDVEVGRVLTASGLLCSAPCPQLFERCVFNSNY